MYFFVAELWQDKSNTAIVEWKRMSTMSILLILVVAATRSEFNKTVLHSITVNQAPRSFRTR
jgi:hypothetical protein